MITTTRELAQLVARARQADAVALDTEFIWERTYYPRLGLIQLALSDEDCVLIDPLAIDDLSPLAELLSDRSVVKILHDAPQDLAILHQSVGVATQNVFDTRLAAGFANLPATLSLCNLVKLLLDIDLAKTETRTNWLQRPLDTKQVQYALDDVRYLRAIRILLLSRIIGPKIKAWLQEELNLLNNPQSYLDGGTGVRYVKLRGAGTLSRRGLAILRDLVDWREDEAQAQNKPRGHILKDPSLVAIARKQLTDKEQLQEKAMLSTKAIKRYGSVITEIVRKAQSLPEDALPPQNRPPRLGQRDKLMLEKLNNLITLKCSVLGIDPLLVGNSSELKELTKILGGGSTAPTRLLRQTDGWRKHFLQDFLRQSR